MLVRSTILGVTVLACASTSVRAGLLDFLFPSQDSACGHCSSASCPPGAHGGTCPPAHDDGEVCYGGHLPCCADVRGCRDRWRLYLAKRCRCLHHETFYPPAPPLFHPTWGYHQTCWRQFPPLPPCPPHDAWIAPLNGHPHPPHLPYSVESGIVPPQPGDASPVPIPTAPEYDPAGESGGDPASPSDDAQGTSTQEPDGRLSHSSIQRFELPRADDESQRWLDSRLRSSGP